MSRTLRIRQDLGFKCDLSNWENDFVSIRLSFQICKMGKMIVQFTKERGLNKIPYYNVGQRDVMITELKKSLVGPRNF